MFWLKIQGNITLFSQRPVNCLALKLRLLLGSLLNSFNEKSVFLSPAFPLLLSSSREPLLLVRPQGEAKLYWSQAHAPSWGGIPGRNACLACAAFIPSTILSKNRESEIGLPP